MPREFTDYVPLADALEVLKRNVRATPRRELVPVTECFGRVLFEDVVSRVDVPPADSSHMDGFAVRSSDVAEATPENPVWLTMMASSPLGVIPKLRVRRGEAHRVLTGGYVPKGADSVVQAESVLENEKSGIVTIESPVEPGEFVFPRGRDMRRGELVLKKGRTISGSDLVLLASLHHDRVAVCRKPRVAVIPTGNELSSRIRDTESGKVVETHSLLLASLIEGAGGLPVLLPIARDDLGDIAQSVRRGLRAADAVLTLAGSSVGEPDLTEKAVAGSGKPGVLVHGMKVFRGRVMGFGAVDGKAIVILPGPIQGAVNAFALMAYPIVRSFLGRGFEEPPSVPAIASAGWDAGPRYPNFTKLVYCRLDSEGDQLMAEPSKGETEKITHLTKNQGYIVVGEDKVAIRKGERVRVHLLPGLSSPLF